jgi:hypothetical protein
MLNNKEIQWIYKLLSVDFASKEILLKQINNATAIFSEDFSFASVKFSVESSTDKFPYNIRVPVEMRVFRNGSAPIIFLLHVIDGYVNELEILTADSSKIDLDSIEFEKVEYDINKELLF